jgi:protein O-GlcNAc transferase
MGIFDLFRPAKRGGAGSGEAAPPDDEVRAARLVDEGNALADEGRVAEAMERYEAALALVPGLARAHLNIGNALLATGQAQGALEAYGAALAARPGYAAAHYNIGNAHARLGHAQAAMAAYLQAARLEPGFVDAWVALGNVQDDLRLHDDAMASYEQALVLNPGYAQVHANLGNLLRQLGRPDDAAQCFRRALELEPRLAQAHLGLGSVLQDQQDWPAALACFRRAATAQQDAGSALAQAYHCANQLCDWSRRQEDELALADMVARGTPGVPPFFLLSLEPAAGEAPLLQRRAGKQFAEAALAGALAAVLPADAREHHPQERLRIGYLSADFHDHATMHLLRGVLAGHDRSKVAIAAYSYGAVDDEMTEQVRQDCETFRDLRDLSDADAAALIAADRVDILVDLKGFTRHTRLGISARRPAPVVVSWLGYPGTLGLPGLADYVVGDAIVTPPQHRAHFSETLALMPHCYQPNDGEKVIGATPTRAEAGLPEDAFVFCSFNQSYKFNPATFGVWCRLLAEVPGSVLWLLPSSDAMAANLQREAAARGIGKERLVFSPTLPLADHLARLGLADLALDTFPYNSHTTGSDALWAAVPLVTRTGSTFASRVAASLLHAAGLPELVTHDWDGYFTLARSLASDPRRLRAIRGKLRQDRGHLPLFDTRRFTRDLERLYARIWQQHESGVREIIVLRDEAGA